MSQGKKGKKKQQQQQRWGEAGDGDDEGLEGMFASAESFAHMLEENEGGGDPGSGTSQALANRDRARELWGLEVPLLFLLLLILY